MIDPRHLILLPFLIPPVAAQAQEAGGGRHILRLEDAPEEHVYQLTARLRHTTVITLPPGEAILD